MLLFSGFLAGTALGQRATEEKPAGLEAFVAKMQQAYSNPSYLSFRVKYSYANEGQPGKYLDSLSGSIAMDKGRFRFSIDGTETLMTDKYTIRVVDEDKMIYLAAARHKAIPDPVAMVDSALTHMTGAQTGLVTSGNSETLTIRFPAGQSYTWMKMTMDSRSGRLFRVEYGLHTTGIVSPEMMEGPGHTGPYQPEGRVDIVFSQYEEGRIDDGVFDESKFITHESGRFLPVGRYKDYQVFLASSNL